MQLGKYKEATQMLIKSIELNPNQEHAFGNLSNIPDNEEIIPILDEALKQTNDNEKILRGTLFLKK
jgi:tetratricopeptide (TPR) repeat protein